MFGLKITPELILMGCTSLLCFFCTLYLMPHWILRAHRAKLVGIDVHKLNQPKVAEMGGIVVICGFLTGSLIYIGLQVFMLNNHQMEYAFTALCSLLIATIIGVVDDILGWKIGIKQIHKLGMTIAVALPIMVINAGVSKVTIPFMDKVDFGIFYPLILVPIGILGTVNGFNILAGYNGLEAGMGLIILPVLGYMAYANGQPIIASFDFFMFASVLAFFLYNKYPAKIFPGDTFTYSVGSLVGITAILANIEKYAIIIFLPYFFQFLLKARGRMKKESFSNLVSDGTLLNRYDKFYGLEHVVVWLIKLIRRKNAKEYQVSAVFWIMELIIALGTIFYFISFPK